MFGRRFTYYLFGGDEPGMRPWELNWNVSASLAMSELGSACGRLYVRTWIRVRLWADSGAILSGPKARVVGVGELKVELVS